ncbi:MAG: DUF3095 domain-containing protein [Polyangiaceae bacterium]
MTLAPNEAFYANAPTVERFSDVPLVEHYVQAPDAWVVVITDVRGSTKAIEAGRYKDVNALGVASIVCVRNALDGVEIPFVFGGDGATLLVPKSRLDDVHEALRGLVATSQEAFGLEMRAGLVPVDELRREGYDVLVARFAASADVSFAMFAGEGFSEAERRIKDPELGPTYAVPDGGAVADFEGFECRWRPIPARHGVALSLLVQATGEDRDHNAREYQRIIQRIEEALDEGGRPLDVGRLVLQPWFGDFSQEARVTSGRASGLGTAMRAMRARIFSTIGRALFATGLRASDFDGKRYREEVVANTDFRKFDDTLRMVLDVSPAQREQIESMLAEEHAAGRIAWGTHAAPATLMTCMIGGYSGNHVHFVDGADGGYALAAKQLKQQLRDQLATP